MLRPPLPHRATSSSSGRLTPERPVLVPLLAEISVFVVPAKLDMGTLVAQIEAMGGERALRPEDATLVITALRGRPRLARVLGEAVVGRSSHPHKRGARARLTAGHGARPPRRVRYGRVLARPGGRGDPSVPPKVG